MATRGRPPKPNEVKRLIGNPGKRPLPDGATVTLLHGASEPPDPARPLGQAGREAWARIWKAGATWLAPMSDAETVLLLCEQIDERQALRLDVLRTKDWRMRAGLRAIESQIIGQLAALGFTPTDRARLGIAEVATTSRLSRYTKGE